MYTMSKKVSAKERVLGFYSSGPRIRPADIHIDALFRCAADIATPILHFCVVGTVIDANTRFPLRFPTQCAEICCDAAASYCRCAT